jgi:ParB family chromosome partitioning protein
MAAWWQPSAEGHFKHVPKAAILQAVGEYAPDQVNRLAKLKKANIASEAERLADGTGWMPVIFKTERQEAATEETQGQDTRADAKTMADEPDEALACTWRAAPRLWPGRFAWDIRPQGQRVNNPGAPVAAPGAQTPRLNAVAEFTALPYDW